MRTDHVKITKKFSNVLKMNNFRTSTREKNFDSELGEIVNIIVSYDMGWSKRGNGTSYDSLNDYGCVIGFLSGKVLDFTTCNRKCTLCNKYQQREDYHCRLSFRESVKGVEPAVTAALVTRSAILKQRNLNVRKIDWRRRQFYFKEMKRKGSFSHLKKCFSYAIGQNNGKNLELAATLRSIPDHVFNRHENYSDWCHRQTGDISSQQKIIFPNLELHNALK